MAAMANGDDDLIPTAEVADILGCNVRTVHRWVDRGHLVQAAKMPGLRGGRLFRRSEVIALRDSLTPEGAA